ncbi:MULTISPECIES: pyruvate dehydrogenase complex dihydrolipoamide acetyltransferase [Asticcacaulis]|uniref:pyruvate dehydrogenase complex dihydrolipoamide acetyltransferase n=1 Tax=Asticcacaulis TaxID=76890 RepID=UPI001AEA5811|nr:MULTISPECIES: pyruvate dehydrogenase complex dihydrolipoamide acetyltransferase [Asticcacaulis]MBP2158307.1 pyruvate dehydrogenase E2 component (dihydrolipoamide acetyltransferase) [Asticcacaulis solisilvae]MDR6799352.1 pyruvate dehydrogenase E2 component (dihydrolipoamide acetyltransferase) [Asticcacaulis sp. BE141]
MTDILMPALSPTMEEGILAKWHVKVGDEITAGQVIAEIETDKATMEVEAVDEGKVEAILVEAGTEGVKVNTPIARLAGGAASPAPKAAEAPKPAAAPAAEAPKAEAPKAAPAAAPAPAAASSGARVAASPLARRLASLSNINLSAIKGSGPHGRIIKRDIEAAQQSGAGKASAAGGAAAPAAEPRKVQSLEQMGIPAGSYDLVPLDGMRKVIARRMTESFRDIPHFPLTVDIELDNLLAARTKINTALESRGVKVSVNDMIIKAVALALKAVPEANASYTPEGIAMHKNADIAVAVAIDGGLITPIVRKAELKTLAEISTEMKDLAQRARDRKLKPEEFQGGTFSVSNLGMFGIKTFTSILNEPQGCIMSVGAGEPRPVVKNGQLAVATVMSVTLTCDHRVVDGSIGAKFISAFKPLIEDPIKMLA